MSDMYIHANYGEICNVQAPMTVSTSQNLDPVI